MDTRLEKELNSLGFTYEGFAGGDAAFDVERMKLGVGIPSALIDSVRQFLHQDNEYLYVIADYKGNMRYDNFLALPEATVSLSDDGIAPVLTVANPLNLRFKIMGYGGAGSEYNVGDSFLKDQSSGFLGTGLGATTKYLAMVYYPVDKPPVPKRTNLQAIMYIMAREPLTDQQFFSKMINLFQKYKVYELQRLSPIAANIPLPPMDADEFQEYAANIPLPPVDDDESLQAFAAGIPLPPQSDDEFSDLSGIPPPPPPPPPSFGGPPPPPPPPGPSRGPQAPPPPPISSSASSVWAPRNAPVYQAYTPQYRKPSYSRRKTPTKRRTPARRKYSPRRRSSSPRRRSSSPYRRRSSSPRRRYPKRRSSRRRYY